MIKKNTTIQVQNLPISISRIDNEDYISLTDMAKGKDGDGRAADIIKNWVRNRSTLEFLGVWEQMYNPNFKVVEFDHFKTRIIKINFIQIDTEYVYYIFVLPLVLNDGYQVSKKYPVGI